MRQPAHNRREDHRCEVLSGVKNRHRRSPFLRRKPGRNNATVAGERWRFSKPDQEAQSKQGNDNAESTKDIDEALLRKGRLAARYEFKDLTTDKVNQLIKEEGLDIPQQTQPMTLAEIYNYEGMDFSLGRKRVGF